MDGSPVWLYWKILFQRVALVAFLLTGGSSSVAERQLPKLNVAGSIPVSRSIRMQQVLISQSLNPLRSILRANE